MTANAGASDGGVQLQAASPVQVSGFVHVSCQDDSRLELDGSRMSGRDVSEETSCI